MTEPVTLPPLHMRRNAFDPTPELAEIREADGVRTVISALGNPVHLITRHEDVKAVLSDHERFSNSRPPGFTLPGAPEMSEEELASARAGNLLGLDPPEHQRLRRMLTAEFTIRRMKRLERRIVEIVDARLDAMTAADPPSDLVADFALPIPSLVICELLGVPYEDRDDFQHRSTLQLDLSLPIAERLALQRQSREYMRGLVGRARRDPGEDILGMLVRDHGAELSDDELVGIAGLLLLAGHETRANVADRSRADPDAGKIRRAIRQARWRAFGHGADQRRVIGAAAPGRRRSGILRLLGQRVLREYEHGKGREVSAHELAVVRGGAREVIPSRKGRVRIGFNEYQFPGRRKTQIQTSSALDLQ